MPRHNDHSRNGSTPEDRFDNWLDAFVAGTPGHEGSRDDARGELARAQTGARQLHDLAARTSVPERTVRQRIEEDLMQQGALATPNNGTTWIPARDREPAVPWWSPRSPVIAGALIFAVIVALAASLFWTQRPALSPGSTDAPGFAVASPEGTLEVLSAPDFGTPIATPETTTHPEGVIVVEGETEQARIEGDIAIATLNEEGLTLPITDGETATIPDITGFAWSMTIHEGQLLVYREGQSPAVLDIDTGELVHELPQFQNFGREYGYGRWYMVPIDEELTDWTIADIVTGETRLLSDVVDLPGDTVMPFPAFDSPGWDAEVFEVLEGAADGFNFEPDPRPVSTFAIGGSLDRMTEVADYPVTLDRTGTPAMVAGDEGRFIAYETRAGDDRIVIVDLESGEELARYGVDDVGDDPTLGGFTEDAQTLVITTGDQVMMLASQGDSAEIVREGLENPSNPLFYPGEAALYFTQGDRVMRLDIPDGELTEIASRFVPGGFSFTKPGGSDWLFFQTQDGVTLVDAASGEIVSRMKLPGATGGFPEANEIYPWIDADGDTMVIGMERQGIDSSGVPGAVWLLSPEFPNGLEIPGPSDEHPIGGAFLSPDGTTLYASTSGRASGEGELWMTPLGDEPDWELLAEGVIVRTFFPFDGTP